jgi:hypothetical protein
VNDETVELEPDDLVARLTTETDTIADVVALVGFLGVGSAGHCRLYADPELSVSMDIAPENIVHRHRIPAEQDALGGRSVIWVKREAMDAPLVEEPAEQLEAEFLTGPLAKGIQLPRTRADLAELQTFITEKFVCYAEPLGRSPFHNR